MDRKYTYGIKGVTDENAVTQRIKKKNGVVDCYIENGKLVYILDEHIDEYDVLVEANELCSKYGGELLFDDEDGEVLPDGAEAEAESEVPNYSDQSETTSDFDGQDQKAKKGKSFKELLAEDDVDYSQVDKIVSKKKQFKRDAIFKWSEIAVAIGLFVVALLIKGNISEFGGKMIIAVIAFALGGYEIFYSAITDLIGKKYFTENIIMTIAAILGAILGYVLETTSIVIVFAIIKAIEELFNGITKIKQEEIFYTGSMEVTLSDGSTAKIEDVAAGDTLKLKAFDVVPCDGVALNAALLDTFRATGVPETKVISGQSVLAGSVVLSDKLSVKIEKTNAESYLSEQKAAFDALIGDTIKVSKKAKIINGVCIAAALLVTFLMPLIVGGVYSDGMRIWGARAIAFIAVTNITNSVYLASCCIKNAIVDARYGQISFTSAQAIEKLGKANQIEFLSSSLTEGGNIKEDTYGCMNELINSGVKNVRTVYDVKLSEETDAKLKFVQKPVKNARTVVVGKDVTLGGDGEVDVGKELSFVPLAYKTARRATNRKTAALVLSALAAVGTVVAMVLVPAAVISPVYIGAMGLAISAVSALLALSSAPKTN